MNGILGLEKLLSPFKLGKLNLKNRIFMSCMNRCRADKDGKANRMMIEYYKQRANAGIMFSEPLYISREGLTRENCSALWSDEFIDGWRRIVDQVHEKEGVIFAFLSHGGRTSHSEINGGIQPVSPSSVIADIKLYAKGRKLETEAPREMSDDDIKKCLDDFHKAAIRAKKIEFDGIGLHGSSGNLVECFIKSKTNLRHDIWGGEGGLDFPIEILKRFKTEFSEDRISIKINPFDHYNDMDEARPKEKYLKLIDKINSEAKIGFIEFKEHPEVNTTNSDEASFTSAKIKKETLAISKHIRKNFYLISNFGTKNMKDAIDKMENDLADFVSVATHYVSNPNLPEKLRKNKPLILPEEQTYYSQGQEGYIDYFE